MEALIIKADSKSSKLLSELAKKLGGDVFSIKEEQFEDFLLGNMMDKVKTGTLVSKETILKKLRSK